MAYTPKRLYTGQPGTTATTLYTASGSTTTSATLTICIVPSGGSQAASNQIVSALPLAGNATITFENIGMLNTGDFISALQGTTSAISLHIYGVEVTP